MNPIFKEIPEFQISDERKSEVLHHLFMGDARLITDNELTGCMIWLSDLVIGLKPLGPAFELARDSIQNKLRRLEDIHSARFSKGK